MKYIVILNGGQGRPAFLEEANTEHAALFDSYAEATIAGKDNAMGNARGFSVVEWYYFEGEHR